MSDRPCTPVVALGDANLAIPVVEALGADVVLAADLVKPNPRIGLPQFPDYLFGRASCLFHQ